MFRILAILVVFFSLAFSQNRQLASEEEFSPMVDCTLLEDENSIICRFEKDRTIEDEEILFQWIDPLNNISRERTMIVPSGHGSIYDFRYIKGRIKGEWIVKVVYKGKDYLKKFEIK